MRAAAALLVAALLVAGICLSGGPVALAAGEPAFVPPLPKDFDKVDVSLLTVERGPQAWALYGHTILRVVDHSTGNDLNFNWGIFDFNGPSFIWNFYIGDLNYMMIITDYWSLIDDYKNIEHRGIIEDKLNLTNAQKEALMRRLIENSRPENLHYQYSQIYNNCSTKVRDHLDAALGGRIQAAFGKRFARTPYRDLIRRDSDAVWWVHLGLDMLLNSIYDVPITVWDEMFLPSKLRDRLAELPAYDDHGRPIAGQMLLSGYQHVVPLPEPPPGPDPYLGIVVLLGLPLVLGLMAVATSPSERRTAVVLGAMSLLFGLWGGVWGSLMASNWALSGYAEVKHNANLWLLWPLDWLYVVYGLRLMIKRARPASASLLARLTMFTSWAHLACLVVALVLWACGAVTQSLLPLLASTGLLSLIYNGTITRFAAARER